MSDAASPAAELIRQATDAFGAGRLEQAAKLCHEALEAQPDCPEASFWLAKIALAAGEIGAARERFERYLAARGRTAQALMDVAAGYSDAGQHELALPVCREAIGGGDERPGWLRYEGDLLLNLARYDEACAAYRRALAIASADPIAWHQLGSALRRLQQYDAAEQAYRRALGIDPGMTEALINLGLLLRDLRRDDEAIALLGKAVAAAPRDARPGCFLGTALLAAGRAREACAALQGSLQINPYFRESLAYFAIALNEAGARGEAMRLLDFDTFVRTSRPAPQGHESIESLNDALAAHVRAHPSLVYERSANTTKGGYHSGDLLDGSPGPVADLCKMVDREARQYFDALPAQGDHPYLWWKPDRWRIQIWGVVLHDGGYQEAHIHRDGWLSGVYYVSVPETVSTGNDRAGWLELGRPPRSLECRGEPITHAVRPQAGLMVLFPSYLFHETIPFTSDEQRICIAFDLLPVLAQS